MSAPGLAAVKADATQEHAAIDELLGWYVNGTLEESSARRVEAHLSRCEACRARETQERALARMMRETPAVELAPQAALARVMQRIERRESRRRWWRITWRPVFGEGALRPLVLAVGVQALVIVMLTTVLWMERPRPAGTYRTLSTPTAAAPSGATTVRVVLDDALTLGELRNALAPWHTSVIGGPEGQGIYTLAVEGDAQAAVEALRRTPGVRFAEVVSVR